MAYRNGERDQKTFLPPYIDQYVGKDDPVRAYDAFVEALNLNDLGIQLDDKKVGNSSYNPKAMLKLIIYGYSYGHRSSRKLERAVYHNLSYMWLLKNLKPDHKTIAEFRRNNKKAIGNILKQCARLCIKLNLIEGNTLFVDGTKIRANAGIKNTWTKERCNESLKKVDARIEKLLEECEEADKAESDNSSLVKMQEELKDKNILKDKINKIVKDLNQTEKKSINAIDSDCGKMNSVQGTHAGYNAQIVVDEKHGLIVNSDVVDDNNDIKQFDTQINKANETLEKKCNVACADSGFSSTEKMERIDEQGIKVIVPSQRQSAKKEPKPFSKERFSYDPENDCYICPEGNKLHFTRIHKRVNETNTKEYTISDKNICLKCIHFKQCTESDKGRSVTRLVNEESRQRFEEQYKEQESQEIYKLRQQKVELPFGHIKKNLGVDAFLIRGRNGAKAEMSVLATCFNITRMITIFGVAGLIDKLMT